MKKLSLLVGALLVSSMGFAGIPSSGLSKNSSELKSLASAFHTTQSARITPGQKNITMVYGGQDVARNIILDPTASA